MPYSSRRDLPDSVRNNLPMHAQDIFVKAFNSAYADNSENEIRSFKIAWAAVKKTYEKRDGKWTRKHKVRTKAS